MMLPMRGLMCSTVGFIAILMVNGCGGPVKDEGGAQSQSALLATRSAMFSDQYEFVQLNKDGSYTARSIYGETEAGRWAKSSDNKQVSLTQSGSEKVEERLPAPALALTPFLEQPCRTEWRPVKGDDAIAYRTLTLKNDGSFSATAAEGGTELSGTWLLGYASYVKRVAAKDGKVSYIPMLSNAIQFKESGSDEPWTVAVAAKGKRGFYLGDDATSHTTGRYPYYKAVHTDKVAPVQP